MHFGPISYCIEVATSMDGVNVDRRFWAFTWRLIPDLAEHASIDGAHKLLTQYVEAVC